MDDARIQSDRDLVRRARSGERQAVDELVARLGILRRIVRSRNGLLGRPLGEAAVADVVQDAIAVVWSKLASYGGRCALETWLYRIATLELANAIRKTRRWRYLVASGDDVVEEQAGQEDDAGDPEAAGDPALQARLHSALADLPAQDEVLLRLKHYGGMTFREIAERLGIPENTVKTRYYRGLRRLRRRFGAKNEEAPR